MAENLRAVGASENSFRGFACQPKDWNSERRGTDDGPPFTFLEFFAGGGMARAGLGTGWQCTFANDFDPMKAATYRANWSHDHLVVGDVNCVEVDDLPGEADLAWASFPCQDLSLAGNYAGIGGAFDAKQTRSGTFWAFWRLMNGLKFHSRAPKVVVLENVFGTLTSNRGRDFAAICDSLSDANYRFGAMVVDAKLFVPQSRPRVFIVAVRGDISIPSDLASPRPTEAWHPAALASAFGALSDGAKANWVWWRLSIPRGRSKRFADLIEENPAGVKWHSKSQTSRLVALMSPINLMKLAAAKKTGRREVGGVYKRTRIENGVRVQRAEVRFDDLSGCLRTPSGGSSRQSIVVVEGTRVRSRLLSPREAARLMGLPDSYELPANYNAAYHVAGDGVVVPVVRHIAECLIEPVLASHRTVLKTP